MRARAVTSSCVFFCRSALLDFNIYMEIGYDPFSHLVIPLAAVEGHTHVLLSSS